MNVFLTGLALAGLSLGCAAIVTAAPPPAPAKVIALRKGNFKEIGGSFKAINDELKSGSPDLAMVRPAARDVAARARVAANLFPRGTGQEAGVQTRALPAIWTQSAEFVQLQRNMIAAATALDAVAAAGNVAALPGAVRAVGMTCKSCHDKFRETD